MMQSDHAPGAWPGARQAARAEHPVDGAPRRGGTFRSIIIAHLVAGLFTCLCILIAAGGLSQTIAAQSLAASVSGSDAPAVLTVRPQVVALHRTDTSAPPPALAGAAINGEELASTLGRQDSTQITAPRAAPKATTRRTARPREPPIPG